MAKWAGVAERDESATHPLFWIWAWMWQLVYPFCGIDGVVVRAQCQEIRKIIIIRAWHSWVRLYAHVLYFNSIPSLNLNPLYNIPLHPFFLFLTNYYFFSVSVFLSLYPSIFLYRSLSFSVFLLSDVGLSIVDINSTWNFRAFTPALQVLTKPLSQMDFPHSNRQFTGIQSQLKGRWTRKNRFEKSRCMQRLKALEM